MLQDRIVCGINNMEAQTRLLEQPDHTCTMALKTVLVMEVAKDAGKIYQMGPGASDTFQTNKLKVTLKDAVCYRCGEDHMASRCKHVTTKCCFCCNGAPG